MDVGTAQSGPMIRGTKMDCKDLRMPSWKGSIDHRIACC